MREEGPARRRVLADVSKNLYYTIRRISMDEKATHACTGKIVAVLEHSHREDGTWYMTVLVERETPTQQSPR